MNLLELANVAKFAHEYFHSPEFKTQAAELITDCVTLQRSLQELGDFVRSDAGVELAEELRSSFAPEKFGDVVYEKHWSIPNFIERLHNQSVKHRAIKNLRRAVFEDFCETLRKRAERGEPVINDEDRLACRIMADELERTSPSPAFAAFFRKLAEAK